MDSTEAYQLLAKSTVAILRLVGDQGRLVGTGFVISEIPHILTCSHVVQPYDASNRNVRYAVVRRRFAPGEILDLRRAELSYIAAEEVIVNPDVDAAILRLNLADAKNREIARAIGLVPPVPLRLSFGERRFGSAVAWLGMAVLNDLMATPRFFEGVIVSSYINDSRYTFASPNGALQVHLAPGLRLIEINQLFIPGCSGGPLLDLSSGKVIGYVHGYRAWSIGTTPEEIRISNVRLESPQSTITGALTLGAPVVTALSRAIDVTSVRAFLESQGISDKKTSLLASLRAFFQRLQH
jgi:S1-C subfamily serine protease